MPVADARVLAPRVNVGDSLQTQLELQQDAVSDYQQLLAQNAAQAAIDWQGVQDGGRGLFGKAQNAIKGSPQLQAGLAAAGLTLMTGGNMSEALLSGAEAADHWNKAKTAEDDKTKTEVQQRVLSTGKLEDSLSAIDLRSRQPDHDALEAQRLAIGAGEKQYGLELMRIIEDSAARQREIETQRELGGLPVKGTPASSNTVASQVANNLQHFSIGSGVYGGKGPVPTAGSFYGDTTPMQQAKDAWFTLYSTGAGKHVSASQLFAELNTLAGRMGLTPAQANVRELHARIMSARRAQQQPAQPAPTTPPRAVVPPRDAVKTNVAQSIMAQPWFQSMMSAGKLPPGYDSPHAYANFLAEMQMKQMGQ